MPDYDERIFWAHFKRAGMLTRARWLAKGSASPVEGDVSFLRPDAVLTTGIVSTEFAIEYQYADFPRLDEGDQILIGETPDVMRFKVREPPETADGNPTGFFRIAKLSRV